MKPRIAASPLRLLVLLVFLSLQLGAGALADEAEESSLQASPGREAPTAEQIQERISALEQSTSINENVRNQALALYRTAQERLNSADSHSATASRFRQSIETAPEQTRRLRERLAQARTTPPGDADPVLKQIETRGESKQLLIQKRAELTALQNRLRDLEEQLRQQQSRPLAARDELTAARQRRDEAERELQAPQAEGESERLREARLAALTAQRQAALSQIAMLEQELLSHDARLALLSAQRDLISFQVQQEGERVRRIQELANLQSRAEAAQAAESAARAKREAWGSHAVLLDIAQINADLSRQLSELVALVERTSTRQDQIGEQLQEISRSYQNTRQQLEIAGLNQALGNALRRERSLLPNIDEYERSARQRQQRITDARLAQFQVEQQRRELPPVETQLREIMERRVNAELPAAERDQIEGELQRLLQDRASLTNELAINYARYIDLLADLNRDQKQLTAQAEQFAVLLDESLFWIASAPPVGMSWLQGLADSVVWLSDGAKWRNAMLALTEGARQTALVSLLVLLLGLLLLRARHGMRERLRTAAKRVDKVHTDHFGLTLQALVVTPLLALPWPLLIYLTGWMLTRPLEMAPFAGAVGQALQSTAWVVFVIECLRQLCRPQGLAQVHFHWVEQSRQVLRRNLNWLLIAAVPITFLIALSEAQPDPLHRDSLGRLAFVFGSLALAVFAQRILHPQRGALTTLRQERLQGIWWWLRYLGYPLGVAIPLLLAAMALYGYHYTALQLQARMFNTILLFTAAGVGINLVVRWLKVLERRLAMTRARARRDAILAEREAAREGGEAPGESWPEPEEPEIDLETIDEQSRGLLHLAVGIGVVVGLWLIWIDLLPALNIFNEFVLWQQTGGDGEQLIPVTLVDLILAASTAAFTLMAARNLPGILEISILPRMNMDAGTRYAITAISRYLIVGAGLIIAIKLLGISWSKAQWLVAALGLGLGFGLQEIFANFVSGLIILFERPIRVGDTVTVGELSGTVTRIRIRATTIADWDRREIIIPNKTFITERLINWTLSDHVTRIMVPVSVSYDTDPERARELILAVARDNARVMEDPEPSVFLTGFGDNALNFELRAFVPEMADRLPLAHELHLGIVRTLREQGIEIPYPQRDLHIRSIDDKAGLRRLRPLPPTATP